MSITIGTNPLFAMSSSQISSSNVDKLEKKIKDTTTLQEDKELLDACKEFESYLLEQVYKSMEKTVIKAEEDKENDYVSMFKDMMNQEYAKMSTEGANLGIAQMLYESMKRNLV